MKIKSLRNVKIKTKLLMLGVVSIIGMWAMGSESVSTASRINENGNKLYNNWLLAVITAEELNTSISNYRVREGYHVIAGDNAMMSRMESEMKMIESGIEQKFATYREYSMPEENQRMMEHAREIWGSYIQKSIELQEVSKKEQQEEALSLLLGESQRLFLSVSNILQQTVETAKEGMEAARVESDALYRQMVFTKIVVIGGISLFVLVLMIYLIRAIEKPVEELAVAARKASCGNLDVYLDYQSEDEIGVLTEAMNELVERLRNIVEDERRMFREIGGENYDVQSACERSYRGDFAPVLYALTSLESRLRNLKQKHKQEIDDLNTMHQHEITLIKKMQNEEQQPTGGKDE